MATPQQRAREKGPKHYGGAKLTFGLLLVAFLLPPPARQAARLGPVAEIALPLLGVRNDAIPAVLGRVLAGIHAVFVVVVVVVVVVAVRALVVIPMARRPPEHVAHGLFGLTRDRTGRVGTFVARGALVPGGVRTPVLASIPVVSVSSAVDVPLRRAPLMRRAPFVTRVQARAMRPVVLRPL